MPFTSTGFILFVAVTALFYYAVPERRKWLVLLAASYAFYAIASYKALIFIVLTTTLSFYCAVLLKRLTVRYAKRLELETDKQNRKELKAETKNRKKLIVAIGLVACFAVLAVLKYANFLIHNVNVVSDLIGSGVRFSPFSFILPLGISFYTFQVVGYILDIYNDKYEPEKSLLRYALCVGWFPALLQGPISRNNEIRAQMFEKEHPFSLEQTQFALQRILWGYLKKLIIADRAADVVAYIFDNHAVLPNYIVFGGLVAYSVQLYADFSGGMDIVLGVSELFGIKLAENFRQPFFSQSISEFWRRWHITLGTWMRDYIFYPFSLSKRMLSTGKRIAGVNLFLGKVIPLCIANLLVFFVVGIWHGAEWHFVVYGLYNGVIIALSALCKPLFEKSIAFFHINENSKGWQSFRIARTFFLVNISWLFDDVTDLRQSYSMLRQLFDFSSWHLISNFHFVTFGANAIFPILIFGALWLAVSLCEEKNIDVRKKTASLPLLLRWSIYLILIFSVPFFQASQTAGFIYAQF